MPKSKRGNAVTVDANGFISVAGSNSLPFKDVKVDNLDGTASIEHVVKDPELGEVINASTTLPTT